MISIENQNRVDWNAIRAEYTGGGISQRKLADKYGIDYRLIRDRSILEGWVSLRENARRKSIAKAEQRIANEAASTAVISERLRQRLLLRLERIEEKYPLDATEVRTRQGNSTAIFRIRDLTAAYKDLADNQSNDTSTLERLDKLLETAWNAAYTETT